MSLNKDAWAREIWNRLRKAFMINKDEFVVHYANNPFEILIAIILSQNTSDKNSIRAFLNLKKIIGPRPEDILKVDIKRLEEAIRSAGLYKSKAKAIKSLAEAVVNGLDLEKVLEKPVREARKILLSIEGIGKKTADVFLSIYGKHTMGIDVHAMRIAMRWKLINRRNYDEAQNAFVSTFHFIEDLDYFHKLLITLGRKYCKAKNPLCDKCPLQDLCPSARKK